MKLDGKRVHQSKYVKYLGILIGPHLNWNYTKMLPPKRSRAVVMLTKIRHWVSTENLHNIFWNFLFLTEVCGQCHNCHIKRITKLQDARWQSESEMLLIMNPHVKILKF